MLLISVTKGPFSGQNRQARLGPDGSLIEMTDVVRPFARPAANDNLPFAARVKAEIAEAARAIGEPYSEWELRKLAADASQLVRSARSRLGTKRDQV